MKKGLKKKHLSSTKAKPQHFRIITSEYYGIPSTYNDPPPPRIRCNARVPEPPSLQLPKTALVPGYLRGTKFFRGDFWALASPLLVEQLARLAPLAGIPRSEGVREFRCEWPEGQSTIKQGAIETFVIVVHASLCMYMTWGPKSYLSLDVLGLNF